MQRKILMVCPSNFAANDVSVMNGGPVDYGLFGVAISQIFVYDKDQHLGRLDERNVFPTLSFHLGGGRGSADLHVLSKTHPDL